MNRKLYTTATALMWLALPLTALRYWLAWDQLPASMATHFAADGHPNGWMPRDTALYYGLGITAFVLLVFTLIAFVGLRPRGRIDRAWWALLGFFFVILGFVFYANTSIIDYQRNGHPVAVSPMVVVTPLVLILFTWIYVRAQRGSALPEGPTLAEETHGSSLFAGVFLLFAVAQFSIFASIPATAARVATGLLGLLLLVIAAHTWIGFRYRFTPAGLEISTLGFRLRSISRDQIGRYRVEHWNALRGYGIRGVGNTRAYVWGNQVVHITTLEGEVFLGHNDPARIVRDLDAMKQGAHS